MNPAWRMARWGAVALALGAIVVGMAIALAGCSNPPQTGRVTARNFYQPYTWYEQMCVARDKYGSCTVSMPLRHDEPARYELCLRADAGDTSHDKTGCFDVDPQMFAGYQVGDHYPDAR